MKKLYLDDKRKAPDKSWIVVRSFDEFRKYIDAHGLPDVVSFDHDLDDFGETPDGYDCAKWMLENHGLPRDWRVHSASLMGAERIRNLLNEFYIRISLA